jgi:hypothetical protein
MSHHGAERFSLYFELGQLCMLCILAMIFRSISHIPKYISGILAEVGVWRLSIIDSLCMAACGPQQQSFHEFCM